MQDQSTNGRAAATADPPQRKRSPFTYDRWIDAQGIPVYRGYYVPDLRDLELKQWDLVGCPAAVVQLVGQEGIAEARITEVPAGATLPPLQLAFDELIYVVSGRGATTVRSADGSTKTSFEWQTNSLYLLPRNSVHQFHNTHGSEPARLLHYSYLPLGMSVIPEPEFFFNNGYAGRPRDLDSFYAEAREEHDPEGKLWGGRKNAWVGNFFPDMAAWDKLEPNRGRGAGGHSVFIEFPGSELSCHMSVFDTRTYKKAHRHGPGRVIVIPAGEGYSMLWEEGKDKILAPWRRASMFVPPGRWFHQHFNVGATPARYLALHPPMQFYGHAEKVEDRRRDQIEYAQEDPSVREMFEAELSKRGLTSTIPAEAYQDPTYEWSYTEDAKGS